MALSNLASRVATAIVVVPFLVAAIVWSNPVAVWGIVFCATAIGLDEFYAMMMQGTARGQRAVPVAIGCAFAAAVYWSNGSDLAVVGGLTAACLATFLYYLFAYGEMESVARRLSASLAGFLYVGLLLTFVALLKRRGPDGGAWVFITLTVTWFSDTGAYFAGRFIGPAWPRKLYEAVSPKKTLIGGLGGLGGSFLAMTVAKLWYLPTLSWVDCAAVAFPAGALGQLGDLCESLLKRSVGVKDSGALLPGHGGMLDRIDALLFCAPYVYFYAHYCYRAAG